MTIQQVHHVSVVVGDLEAAMAFFVELGMELEGQEPIEGPGWTGSTGSTESGSTSR